MAMIMLSKDDEADGTDNHRLFVLGKEAAVEDDGAVMIVG